MRRIRDLLPVLCAAAVLLSILPRPEPARADGFTVAVTTDAPHDAPINGNCTSTLGPGGAGGPCTLRAAIQAANYLGGAQTINLPAGTYMLTVTGQNEGAAATGDLNIAADLTLVGAGASSTFVDGNHTDRVFDVHSGHVTMSGITIQNGGSTSNNPSVNLSGAGVWVNSGAFLTLTDTSVLNNSVPFGSLFNGGGIYNAGTLTLNRTTISGNSTITGQGGGIYNNGTMTLTDVTIAGGGAQNAVSGGAITNSGAATLTNVTVTGNVSVGPFGGVIGNDGTLNLVNVNIDHNQGGAIYNTAVLNFAGGILDHNLAGPQAIIINATGATGTVSGVVISNSQGGGIANAGQLTLSASTLSANTVSGGHGGGIQNTGTATLTNVTISGNAASFDYGGGVYNTGTLSITNGTLSGNSASHPPTSNAGGGIMNANSGTVTLKNTIVANSPTGGNCAGTITSSGNNLSSDTTCGFSGPGDLNNLDPRLGPLQVNASGPPTHALLSDSPAVDAGSNTGCPATDERGVARPVDGTGRGVATCDIGAFEYQPPPFAATRTPTPTPTLTPTLTATPVDTTPPVISSFGINGGALATTSGTVALSLAANDDWSGLADMSFSNDGSAWGNWQPYATTTTWTLSSGDGAKTVSARVRDRRGNVSQPATAGITLDAAAGTDYGVTVNQGALFTNTADVNLTIGARPNTAQMQVSNDGGFAGAQWEPYNSRKPWQITQFGNYVIPRTVYVKYKDGGGNVTGSYQDDIILDVTPPTGSVSAGQGPGAAPAAGRAAPAPRDPVGTVTLSATDDVSGVADMRLANRGDFAGAPWEPYATSKAWNFDNANTVYVQFRDRAGNVSQTYSAALGGSSTTALPTPTLVPVCTPRPPVTVTSAPSGGSLQVTVVASAGAHAWLQTLRIGAATNALIDVNGQTGLSGNATITLPAGTQQVTLTVHRATAGQATTVPLVITDSCGDWPTFVGGGAGAF